jgi:hypothetical protein
VSGNAKGTIEIVVVAGGRQVPAPVEVDGKRLGTSPRSFTNKPGRKHVVRIDFPPFPPSRFELLSGPTGATVEVELAPAGTEPPGAAPRKR